MTFTTHGFELVDWQQAAVEAWLTGVRGRRGRGTIEIFTGGGKTLIALRCAARIAEIHPDLKIVVVVPTKALASQWVEALVKYTSVPMNQIGVLGSGRHDSLTENMVLVAVLNSAAKQLPEITSDLRPVMLIVDEVHRAGAPKFSRALDARAAFRLGLSATPDREEIGDDGELLSFDEQLVGQKIGSVVYSFGLKEARLAGWLPEYLLSHHAVALTPEERERYSALSRQVDDVQDGMRDLGGDPQRARHFSRRDDLLGDFARRWVTLTGQRKDLLYRASERRRIAVELVSDAFAQAPAGSSPRVILFHERVHEAESLRAALESRLPSVPIALEHSGLPEKVRRSALSEFASGKAPVLVSVKSLIEGIDVPEADTGISVASTASVRQRIQSLGRVLRRSRDGSKKTASMHLIYVDETVDDLIYGKTDWSDLTGETANVFWRWSLSDDQPEPMVGPPRNPLPTEEQSWNAMIEHQLPAIWPGEVTGQEYSVDSNGVVHNSFKRLIANPQGVGGMIGVLRKGKGGRFRVTPTYRLVIVWEAHSGQPMPWVVGQLAEPFAVAEEVQLDSVHEAIPDLNSLMPGREYHGPSDKEHGTFRISQRGRGTIERSVPGGREFASVEGGSVQAVNARRTIEAWQSAEMPTTKFFVNTLDHAWYEAGGSRFFLALVPGGFAWPDETR